VPLSCGPPVKERIIKLSIVRGGWTLIAWALLCVIVFTTWGPQSLRPHLGDPQFERFGAYFAATVAFVFAYPRRPAAIAAAAVVAALFLEVGQLFIPGRDAGVADAMAKAMGGLAGAALAAILSRPWRMFTNSGAGKVPAAAPKSTDVTD
jgi:VanZ family protein